MTDQIVFSQEPTSGQGPNDAALAAQFESGGQQQQVPPQSPGDDQPQQSERPDWLPDNFKTVEDFRKSYDEQQKTLTKLQQELANIRKAGSKASDDAAPKDGSSEQQFDPRSVTEDALEPFTLELAETGELSEESRAKALEMFPVPEFILDTYIEGIKAITANMTNTIDQAFGGAEQRDAMLAWAGENLPENEINVLEKQLNSNDINTTLFAIDALRTKYEAANGRAPARVLGGKSAVGSTGGFQSWEQVTEAMADPRYRSDPAFRNEVAAKLAAFKG